MRMRWVALSAWCVLVAGCFSSLKVPAPVLHDYRLDYPPPTVEGTPLPVILQIARFRSDAIYAREPIVYRNGEYETGTYPYHRWVASPASMIGDLCARDFAAAGLYRAVQHGASLLMSEYELGADIDAIEEHIVPNGCSAYLSMRVIVFRTRASDNPLLLRQAYTADEPCTERGPDGLVGAMSRALQQISERLQRDVYDVIARDVTAKRR